MVVIWLIKVLCFVVVVLFVLNGVDVLVDLDVLVVLLWFVLCIYYCNEFLLMYVVIGDMWCFVICLCIMIVNLYVLCSVVLLGVGVCVGLLWLLVGDFVCGDFVYFVFEW